MADTQENSDNIVEVDDWGIPVNYKAGARKSVAQAQDTFKKDGTEEYGKSLGLDVDPILDPDTDDMFLFRQFWIDYFETDDAVEPSFTFPVNVHPDHAKTCQFRVKSGGCFK